MAKTHVFNLSGDVGKKLAEVREGAAESGIVFEGDVIDGTFRGKGVKGFYRIQDQQIAVTVTKKPFIVSHKYIKKKLRAFIEG